MTTPRTYGIFSLQFLGQTSKEVREIGWVHDLKWAFVLGARPERKFELQCASLLFKAADTGGLQLEISPQLDGEHLPGVMVPTTLQGNLTTVADGGRTQLVTRVSQEALEQAGLTLAVFFESSCSLECRVSDMPTLEESIQSELKAGQPEIDADALLNLQGTLDRMAAEDPGLVIEAYAGGHMLTRSGPAEEQDAPPLVDVPPPPTLRLDPLQPGEDLPFPIDDDNGQQPSA
ncbi:hypothetical protein [Deinococcus yunweiensis]|uniref:hypothetical protein n=1 Tax=Deinococcus yunweiensis TaxID=367282 RepID=UPI00398F676B